MDEIVAGHQGLWKLLDISRPVHPHHRRLSRGACQKIFTQLYEQGDIYKGVYKGHYCKPCESFWTDSQLKGRQVPGLRPRGVRG